MSEYDKCKNCTCKKYCVISGEIKINNQREYSAELLEIIPRLWRVESIDSVQLSNTINNYASESITNAILVIKAYDDGYEKRMEEAGDFL